MAKDVRKLFGWREKEVRDTLSQLEDSEDALRLEDGRWAKTKLFRKNM
jgi:hypothetical protein